MLIRCFAQVTGAKLVTDDDADDYKSDAEEDGPASSKSPSAASASPSALPVCVYDPHCYRTAAG